MRKNQKLGIIRTWSTSTGTKHWEHGSYQQDAMCDL